MNLGDLAKIISKIVFKLQARQTYNYSRPVLLIQVYLLKYKFSLGVDKHFKGFFKTSLEREDF